ncbi:hypothetical protein K2Z84_21935 [Candidatus Binatia bacterium]|jgi:hypothetical protein|nr:hypothetical protein [Candidatus Binatia bacterium]
MVRTEDATPERLAPDHTDDERRGSDRTALAAVLALSSLVTVWWLWPGIPTWDTEVAYAMVGGVLGRLQEADFYLNAWAITWASHALATDPTALFHGNTFFPARYSLAYSESLLGYVPLFAPIYWATGNAILALNAMTALTYPLAAVCAFLMARLWLRPAPAALVGMLYAFTLGRYVTAPHYQYLGVAGFPLIVLGLEQWLRHARTRSAVLLVCAIVWQSMCSAYFLYGVLTLLLVLVPASLWHHRARLDRRRILGLGAAGAAAAGFVVALMWPYLVLRAQGLMAAYDDQTESAGLVPFIARKQLQGELFVLGPNAVAWVLAAVGVLLPERGELRWAKRAALLLVVTGCVAALGPRMALGFGEPIWSPYVLLRDWVPGFATVRNVNRFAVLATLGVVLLAGLGAQRLTRRLATPTQAALVVVTVVVALALLRFPPLPAHPVPEAKNPPAALAWLREHGDGRALLELPAADSAPQHSRRTFLSTAHWHPVVEGYATNGPKHVGMIGWLSRALPDGSALQQIVDLVDVGWLLVHRGEMDARSRALWDGPLPAGLERVAAFDTDVLYRVTRAPRHDRRALLVNATTTLDGTKIGPVAASCSGSIAFVGWNRPPTAGQTLRADLTITNASAETWPAAGFLPAGLVAIDATVVDATNDHVVAKLRVRLDQDLQPNVRSPAKFWLPSPLGAGRYVLRVHLVQPVRGALDDCVPPIEVPFEVAPSTTPPAGLEAGKAAPS